MKKIVSLLMSILMVAVLLPYNSWALELTEDSESFEEVQEEIFEETEETPTEDESEKTEYEVSEPISAENQLFNATASGTCGASGSNVKWEFTGTTLIVSGTGKMKDYTSASAVPWYKYLSEIKYVSVRNGVTRIGNHAFDGFVYTTYRPELPSSITSIGDYAFYGCGFDGELALPSSLATIGNYAFASCEDFTGSLVIPDSVTSIGDRAFYYCEGFDEDLIIGKNVTTIGYEAFYNCSGFSGKLKIGKSVSTIGAYAFSGCSGFSGRAIMGSSITDIGTCAFFRCGISEYYFGGDAPAVAKATDQSPSFDKTADIIVYPSGNDTWEITGGKWNGYIARGSVASGYCGYDDGTNLEWVIEGNGVLTISGTGKMNDYSTSKPAPWKAYSDHFDTVVIEEGTTNIGKYAFYKCSNIIGEFKLPNSITEIKDYTFDGCSGFTGELNIPDKVTSIGSYAFNGCTGFTGDLVIPNKVVYINGNAFSGCKGFNGTLTIPESVTRIGGSAFSGCSGFVGDLIIPSKVTTVDYHVFAFCSGFNGKLVIPSGVTSIGDGAFYHCSGLTGNLTIPGKVTTIGGMAFDGCSGFTGDLIIPDKVTTIGEQAFLDCSGFDGELVLGSGLKIIESHGFRNCTGLTGKLVLPENINIINGWAFAYCSGFAGDVDIPASVTTVAPTAFTYTEIENANVSESNLTYTSIDGIVYSIDKKTLVLCPGGRTGNIIIPEHVVTIGDWAFSGCQKLTGDLAIPESVTTIGNHAFENCTGFSGKLSIGSKVVTIGNYAFNGNNFVGRIVLPETLTTIGDYAFRDCGIKTFYFLGNAPSATGGNNSSSSFDTKDEMMYYMTGKTGWPVYSGSSWNGYSAKELLGFGYCGGEGDGTNLEWILGKDGVLVITGTGKMADYSYETSGTDRISNAPWIKYASELKELDLQNGMTTIGDAAFSGCTNLTGAVTIPGTVTLIGNSFENCSINEYYFSSNPPRVNSSSETNPSFDAASDTIYYPFDNREWVITDGKWNGYKAVGWKNDLVDFGYCGAVGNEENLKWALKKDGTLTIWGTGAMADYYYEFVDSVQRSTAPWAKYPDYLKKLVFEEGMTSIGEFAFYKCSGFTGDIVIPKGVTTIGKTSFFDCTGFNGTLTIPDTVAAIGESVFMNCTGLTGNIVIPDSVKVLGFQSFKGCTGFNGTLSIGKGLYIIQNSVFFGCTGLTGDLILSENITDVATWAFKNCGIDNFYFKGDAPSVHAASAYYPSFDAASDTIYYIIERDNWNVEDGLWNGYKAVGANLGDVYSDDAVNVMDASYVRRMIVKLVEPTAWQRVLADVNADGKVNVVDANLIRKFAAKIITSFPI